MKFRGCVTKYLYLKFLHHLLKSFSIAALILFFQTAKAVPPPLPAESAQWVGQTLSGAPCQGGAQGYGPYDYTNPALNPSRPGEPLYLVEIAHFTPRIELLDEAQANKVNRPLLPDIDYTLRAFPNHHRALNALIRYYFRLKQSKPSRWTWTTPPECYLQRAIRFKPDDGIVRMLFGIYLHKSNLLEKALQRYHEAEKLMSNSAELHNNIGLLYFDMQNFSQAKAHAIRAYQLGYPLPGLRRKLQRAGHW